MSNGSDLPVVSLKYCNMEEKFKNIYISLCESGVLQFGDFQTGSFMPCLVYFDLYRILDLPVILNEIGTLLAKIVTEKKIGFDYICGIPYAGINFASILSLKTDCPQIIKIKENSIDLVGSIEGNFESGKRCILVEEVIASGRSILEAITHLKSVGLTVTDVIVIIDLCQNGVENLRSLNYEVHPVINFLEMAIVLRNMDCISNSQYEIMLEDKISKFSINGDIMNSEEIVKRKQLSYVERSKHCKNMGSVKLLNIISSKKTNLCVDVASLNLQDVIEMCHIIGPYICLLIICSDTFLHVNAERTLLKTIAKQYNFLLMDDRKLSGEDETVAVQYKLTMEYADFVTIVPLSENLFNTIQKLADKEPGKGIFVICDTHLHGYFNTTTYREEAIHLGNVYSDIVTGFISLSNKSISSQFLHIIRTLPNVHLNMLINDCGADIGVVKVNKNGITEFSIKENRDISWNSYLKRILCNSM